MTLKIVWPSTGGARLSFVNAWPSFCTTSYIILTSFLLVMFLLSWRGYVRPSFFIAQTLLLIVRPSFSTVRHRPYQTLRTPLCGHVRLSFCKVRPSLGIMQPSSASSFFFFVLLSTLFIFLFLDVFCSIFCKYVSLNWGSSGTRKFCLQCKYVSLKFSQGQNVFRTGGFEVNWGNKGCKYVHNYFFVFLSIQFLSIVFLNMANSLQTIN